MSGMFGDCQNFTSVLNNWKVDNVTDMSYMFSECNNFTSELGSWKVDNVTNMSNMFSGCNNFTSVLNNWKVDNVTDMSYMFNDCEKFISNLSNWKVDNVTDMFNMFTGCLLLQNTYPNLPDTPTINGWKYGIYWYEQSSEHEVNIGFAIGNNNLYYKGYWSDETIIYTFEYEMIWPITPPLNNINQAGSLSNPYFKNYKILGAFFNNDSFSGNINFYITYSTNLPNSNDASINNELVSLVNNIFLTNEVEVSVEFNNQTYTDSAVSGDFSLIAPINDINGHFINGAPQVVIIGYTINMNSNFYKIVNGDDYGNTYKLKITQRSNYP
jgi:surface protein